MHLRVLIVDDERLSRRRLRRLLSTDEDLEILGECENGLEAEEMLSRAPTDLLFLDIQMPGKDGFNVLESIGIDRAACTIFVTAYDQYALRAFEVHAFDYLLKPYEEKRLREAVQRVKAHLAYRRGDFPRARPQHAQAAPDSQAASNRARDRLAVRTRDKLILLRFDQVDWIEAADNYVYVHCGSETHTLRQTMNALQETLDPQKFLRIHRSAIVNLDRVKSLQPWFRGDYRVIMSSGAELTLSRSYRNALRERIVNM
jgi:two-component system, LytTR family, response regulator